MRALITSSGLCRDYRFISYRKLRFSMTPLHLLTMTDALLVTTVSDMQAAYLFVRMRRANLKSITLHAQCHDDTFRSFLFCSLPHFTFLRTI
jgi:hypothetical protein